jgi:hypothetical protein
MSTEHNRIRTLETLTARDIADVASGAVLALRVPGYTSPQVTRQLAAWMDGHPRRVPYEIMVPKDGTMSPVRFGVERVGTPFNTLFSGGPAAEEAYFDAALAHLRELRQAAAPDVSPIDRLRLDLDEIWPEGARIARYRGKRLACGIARATLPDAAMLEDKPHCDTVPLALEIETQLSANVYCAAPEVGGELELWDGPMLSNDEIYRMLERDLRRELPEPVRLRPRPGDLVLINTRKPHAVRRFPSGERVSVQCFLGWRAGGPIVLWS